MGEAMKKTSQLLVGSIPLRSALDVFTTASDYFGDNLAFMPDGEFGDTLMRIASSCSLFSEGYPTSSLAFILQAPPIEVPLTA
jgi:hypothetical protein